MRVVWAMRALIAVGLLVGTTTSAANIGGAPTRLDPALRLAAEQVQTSTSLRAAKRMLNLSKSQTSGQLIADIFIKTTDVAELTKIVEQWDGKVRTVAGNIVSASLPLEFVANLSSLDIVQYIEAAKPVGAKLNQSLAIINADDVQSNSADATTAGLTQPYTGAGVIVGVIDSGIDCEHDDFNDGSGDTRMLAYWDQTSGTAGVDELTGSEGTEYTGSDLGSGGACSAAADGDSSGHGTHVAGIATSSDSTYKGVAPAAKIIAVKHNALDAESGGSFATTVTDAVNYIFRKANSNSMPAVVNLSLGTSLGAHDGTSLFEQSLDALLQESGADKQGRAIVNAAGNENMLETDAEFTTFAGIHATVSQSSSTKAFDFLVRNAAVFTSFGGAQIDIWLTSGSSCTVQIDAYEQNDKSLAAQKIDMDAVSIGNSSSGSSNTDGKLEIALDFTDSTNANNGKQHALGTVTRVSNTSSSIADYSFEVIFTGTCEGDVWLYPDITAAVAFRRVAALPVATNPTYGYAYVSGDSNRTITIPGTANKVITVGAFMGSATWTNINSITFDQTSSTGGSEGGISTFSSLGPTADARVKPDLAAPGEPIVSTSASTSVVSTSSRGDATHHMLAGSSMAAPHVAGAIALMLERNGCLTPTEIKTALTDNVITDADTGSSLPNNTWGYGKLNALASVAAITPVSCAPSNASEAGSGTATGGGGNGGTTTSTSGGCSLIPSSLDMKSTAR